MRPPTGLNGPTIFTGRGELDRITRGEPFGPNGGVLHGIHVTIPQGGPTGGA